MKRTHKKIIGFLGLLTVVAVTAVAIFMPSSETQATSSVQDTIVVQVVTDKPDVSIGDLPDGEIITSPVQTFTVNYSNVNTARLVLRHTSLTNEVTEYTLDELAPGYAAGKKHYTIFFTED